MAANREQLLEGAGAAGEVLVAGIGHALGERRRRADRDVVAGIGEALGDRQERVEVAGRGKARQEDPHLGQEPPRAFEVRMRTELLEDRGRPREIRHRLPRLRLPEEDPRDVEGPVLAIEQLDRLIGVRATTRPEARSSRRRRHANRASWSTAAPKQRLADGHQDEVAGPSRLGAERPGERRHALQAVAEGGR